MTLKMAYWVVTDLFGLMMASSGFMYLSGAPQALEGFKHLGYPDYFRTLLGSSRARSWGRRSPRTPPGIRPFDEHCRHGEHGQLLQAGVP